MQLLNEARTYCCEVAESARFVAIDLEAAGELPALPAAAYDSPREAGIRLWNRGQEPEYKAVPRHRTRTVYY